MDVDSVRISRKRSACSIKAAGVERARNEIRGTRGGLLRGYKKRVLRGCGVGDPGFANNELQLTRAGHEDSEFQLPSACTVFVCFDTQPVAQSIGARCRLGHQQSADR